MLVHVSSRNADDDGTCMHLLANSTPMVDLVSRLNSFFVNRESRLDLPTPESPADEVVLVLELLVGRCVSNLYW